MKKLMVAIAAAAISFAGFAEGSWFTAGFTDEGASTGGAWLDGQDGVTEPTFSEGKLVLEDVEATAPVVFQATDYKETDEATVVFRSAVNFVGFDELPAIDATAKAGVCALTDGNYWVVSYDSEGVTNKWVDTGIAAILDSADTVTVSVSTNVAVYSFGNADGFVCPINGNEFQEVCYSGNGTVTSLEADHAFNGLAIILPVIDGLTVSCDKTRAAVGSEVTVNFAAGTKIPSKGSAVYIVQEDGSLTIKAGDSEPEAYDPAAKIDDELYLTFAAAYEAASADDTIELCTSQVVDADAGITIDKNIEVNLAGFAMTNVNDFTISEATLTVTGEGEWVIAAPVDVADTDAVLDISAIKWSLIEDSYLTGTDGTIKFGEDCDSPNKMFHDGVLIGEDADTLAELNISVGESQYACDSGADVPRYVNSEEIAYAYIGATGEGYYDSFATVQDAIDVSDEVYLSDNGYLPSEEDLEFNANTIVYACNGEDDLDGELTVDGGEVEWDDTLGDNGAWKAVTGEPPVVDSYVVSWSGADNAMVVATVGGKAIENGDEVEDGKEVNFVVTPNTGYVFAEAEYEGWVITEDGNLTRTIKVDGEPVSLTIPDATQIPVTTKQIQLPAATAGVAGYIVSNVTDGVAIPMEQGEQLGGATYTLPLGVKVEIWVVPADGYRVTGNPYVIEEVMSETTVDAQDLPAVAAIPYVAQIGEDKYETLQAALAAVADGAEATIKILDDLALTEMVAVNGKDITFDLGAKTVTFTGCSGFYFLGCDGAVTNGTVTMDVPATKGSLFAINFEEGDGLVKDVVVNAGNCKYGVVSSCDDCGDDNYNDATVVCKNVDVSGSGMLFYAESQAMTLDENCSATQSGENAAGAVHSDALAAGWLGQLTVNGGTYTAEGNVVATMSSPANIKLVDGTFTGAVTITPVSEGYKEMGEHIITKAVAVELAAPAGYEWSVAVADMQKLVKTYTVTYVDAVVTNGVTKYTVETETFLLPKAADVEAMPGGQFKGWTNELGVVVTQVEKGTTGDLTFYAVWEAAGVFYPTYIPDDDGIKEKFNIWATDVAKNRDGASENLEAFLLNCVPTPEAVATAKAAFKIISITKTEDGWVCKVAGEKGEGAEYGNGYVHFVSVKEKFGSDGTSSDFFQATLTLENPATE